MRHQRALSLRGSFLGWRLTDHITVTMNWGVCVLTDDPPSPSNARWADTPYRRQEEIVACAISISSQVYWNPCVFYPESRLIKEYQAESNAHFVQDISWGLKTSKTAWWFHKTLNIEWPGDSAIPLLGRYSQTDNKYLNKFLYTNVQIHCSRKVKTTWMSTNRWLDIHIVVHFYDRISFSHKEDWSTDTRYNVDELKNMFGERSQPQKVTYWMIPFTWNIQNR